MSSTDVEINPYELLDLKLEATDQEIRTAYRQRSLKVHPDRNRNNPDAARKFHELNQAYELLLDPLRRLALDAKLRAQEARKLRFAAYDNKRKNLVEELEQREYAFKKAKLDKEKEELERWRSNEDIMEQGRRLREQKEKETRLKEEQQATTTKESEDGIGAPELGPLDTTVKLKFTVAAHPELSTPESISALLRPFGPTDTIVLNLKSSKKNPGKPPKYGTALAPFARIGDAFAAVCASGRKERGLEGIELSWAGGREPEVLDWLRRVGKLDESLTAKASTPLPEEKGPQDGGSFSSFPSSFPPSMPDALTSSAPSAPGLDYESLTLMRLRQAERERLEREIREQEEAEG